VLSGACEWEWKAARGDMDATDARLLGLVAHVSASCSIDGADPTLIMRELVDCMDAGAAAAACGLAACARKRAACWPVGVVATRASTMVLLLLVWLLRARVALVEVQWLTALEARDSLGRKCRERDEREALEVDGA
jgi:hypothetical protein